MARAYFFWGLRMARSAIAPGPGPWLPAPGTAALTWGVRPDTLVSRGVMPATAPQPGLGGNHGRRLPRSQTGHAGAYRMLRFAVPGAGRYPYLTSMSISMPTVPRSASGRVA